MMSTPDLPFNLPAERLLPPPLDWSSVSGSTAHSGRHEPPIWKLDLPWELGWSAHNVPNLSICCGVPADLQSLVKASAPVG